MAVVARCALSLAFAFLVAVLGAFAHHYVLMTDAYVQALLAL